MVPTPGTVSVHGSGSLISLELRQSYSMCSWDRDTSSPSARGGTTGNGHAPLLTEYWKKENDKAGKISRGRS